MSVPLSYGHITHLTEPRKTQQLCEDITILSQRVLFARLCNSQFDLMYINFPQEPPRSGYKGATKESEDLSG